MATTSDETFNEKPDNFDAENHGSSVTTEDGHTNPTGIDEKKLLRKIDLKLLPPLTLLYLLSFLDRSNSTSHPGDVRGHGE